MVEDLLTQIVLCTGAIENKIIFYDSKDHFLLINAKVDVGIEDNSIIIPDIQAIIDAAIPSTSPYTPTIDEYVTPGLRTPPRTSSNISALNQGKRNKSSAATITLESVRLCIGKQKNKKNRTGKSRIYTDTPEKNSETEQSVNLESDELNDDFSDFEYENSPYLLLNDDIIHENDYLVVKFQLKSNIVHCIGTVTEVINVEDFEIKFLRQKSLSYQFFYPAVEDKATVDRAVIIPKLPALNSPKTTRTSSLISFDINLSSYTIK
ncbi:hypothetical protein FQA39_LY00197 [Lamprigera yunnana]|nr:hypothetical protein FQA39_LY00197 [Lamprigera yunnana]